jgi:hypothetical protein
MAKSQVITSEAEKNQTYLFLYLRMIPSRTNTRGRIRSVWSRDEPEAP